MSYFSPGRATRPTATGLLLAVLAILSLLAGRLPTTSADTPTASVTVPGKSDIWLAGMPVGTIDDTSPPHWPPQQQDSVPNEMPAPQPADLSTNPDSWGLPVVPGSILTFDVTGTTSYNGSASDPPDGNEAVIANHQIGAMQGIADIHAPQDSLVGVFLGPGRPDQFPELQPDALDFTTSQSRNYTVLNRLRLRQPFFVGDGRTEGMSPVVQQVVVPPCANRLFLGDMDGGDFENNGGQFNVTVHITLPSLPPPPPGYSVYRIDAPVDAPAGSVAVPVAINNSDAVVGSIVPPAQDVYNPPSGS